MALKHKYIRLVKTDQDYQDMVNNRELEEAAVVAVINDRTDTPDEYQFSTRTTNEDNEVKGAYNAFDNIHTFGGLELIWGYFGWTWEDCIVPSDEQEEETVLKGGHFIILKDTTEYPEIYDGYRLQHINDLCSQLKKVTSIGYFDNSEVISAENAFTTIVKYSGYNYYYDYGRLDERDNIWTKLLNVTYMFCSENTFSKWSLPDTELYLPAVINCNYLFYKYTLGKCPIVNFNNLEVITAFADLIYKSNYNDTLYFGDYEESIAKGLTNCYDYGIWNLYTQGDYKFKSAYIGDNTFVIPIVKAKTSSIINTTIECNIPWTIQGEIESYSGSYKNLRLDLTNLDFTKSVTPNDKTLTLLKYLYVSQDTSNDNYIPGLPKIVQNLWLMNYCYIKGDFVFDARNDALDYNYFREFNNCRITEETDSLTINNLHLWNQIELNVSGSYRIDIENSTISYYEPYNINIQLCPKVNGNIQKVQYSYLNLPYMIHKDEDIELIGYDYIGYDEEIKFTSNKYEFKGVYKNCIYHINGSKPVELYFLLADGVTPILESDVPVYFKSNDFLGHNWGLDRAGIRKVYLSGLKLPSPSEIIEGMDTNNHRNSWYWYFPEAVDLEYIDLPAVDNMAYRFDRCSKLDHNCILNIYNQVTKVESLNINRLVWNKLSPEEQSSIRAKTTNTLTIYENEN